ncbi:molybdopterin synthase sulfur carrier subunit [Acetobacter cibinongensis]|uniref:Molybdopterin synthase sulfur carrier subunit n=1 Tax=Acetobacter cibinongensis TaxID=146475 RepID=A0A0D6N6X6_9PROT|nr:molybdopterin converting factor subunit 1 [Acetobacter cibinongensis]GAN61308.1 molybdopterin converting factor small subunit MoeD [Acetobacter cibinongensis]GBQ17046.1 molybdopterin converting factor small subunit MoeD [Acetobacter cibinongensis NRIC 0482]GEL57798.1 molybdopterin synthase sulfur carrier subunit [Acetobacter cibinongensis]
MTLEVTVLYFASLREQVGREQDKVVLPAGATVSVCALLDILSQNDPELKAIFERMPRLRVAINQALATFDGVVKAGDEIAFFPPMTGG